MSSSSVNLNSVRNYSTQYLNLNKNIEKLTSGYRINHAADDAAGLAISEKFRTQTNGLTQSSKNIQDGISLIQTAEGAYEEITSMLQRMRVLSIQSSNGSLTDEDRSLLQEEINQLVSEINRFEDTVEFNGIKLLKGTSDFTDSDLSDLQQYLNDNWIAVGQQMSNLIYDMGGVGGPMDVVLENGSKGGVLAYVATWESGTNIVKQELHIELADFEPITYPNGGSSASFYNDRVIQHEMVHAAHAWHSDGIYKFNDTSSVPTWFKEAVAEYSHGVNDRVLYDGGSTAAGASSIRSLDLRTWGSTSKYYSSAYESAMYMNRKYGGGAGDDDGNGSVLDEIFLQMGAGKTFDQALDYIDDGTLNSSLDEDIFMNTYNNDAAYDAQIISDANAFYNAGALDGDTGGYWAIDGGSGPNGKSAEDTVDDTQTPGLGTFTLNFDSSNPDLNAPIDLQVGANVNQKILLELDQINTITLFETDGSLNISTQTSANEAIGLIDIALQNLSEKRSKLGAIQNRLEHTLNFVKISNENQTAAESRIRDVDFAEEMTDYSKNQVLTQVSQSVVSKSNLKEEQKLNLISQNKNINLPTQNSSQKLLNQIYKNDLENLKSQEKLSSGYRINRAADDAAGLAVSEKFRTQTKGLEQANKNVTDGISLFQTLDGALEDITSLIHRVRLLSVQAANGILTDDERNLIQLEINQLVSEIDRLNTSVEFNTIKLLNPGEEQSYASYSSQDSTLIKSDPQDLFNPLLRQDGRLLYENWTGGGMAGDHELWLETAVGSGIFNNITNDPAMDQSLYYQILSPDGNTVYMYEAPYSGGSNGDVAKIDIDGNNYYSYTWNTGNSEIALDISPDSNTLIIGKGAGSTDNYYFANSDGTGGLTLINNVDINFGSHDLSNYLKYSRDGSKLFFIAKDSGGIFQLWSINSDDSSAPVQLTSGAENFSGLQGFHNQDKWLTTRETSAGSGIYDMFVLDYNGNIERQIEVQPGSNKMMPIIDFSDEVIYFSSNKNGSYDIWSTETGYNSSGLITENIEDIIIQCGANKDQTVKFKLKKINSEKLGLSNLNVTTQTLAEESIRKLDDSLDILNSYRAKEGSFINRLESIYQYNSLSLEKQTQAESRIRDTNYSEEMINYTKTQIVHQASLAMLAQSNINSSMVMRLF